MRLLVVLLTVLLLSACATGPEFPTEGVDPDLTPAQVVSRGDSALDRRVIWGGTIVASRNLEGRTLLEVLSYPLDGSQRPDTDEDAGQRFLIEQEGYLETADYAPGRAVTVTGEVIELRSGQVGEADYTYPAVTADRLHLWPVQRDGGGSRFSIGIGVIFSN